MMVEHESILLRRSEAEAGVEVVPQSGNVVQSQAQVALTGEVSLARHLHKKKTAQVCCNGQRRCTEYIPAFCLFYWNRKRKCVFLPAGRRHSRN